MGIPVTQRQKDSFVFATIVRSTFRFFLAEVATIISIAKLYYHNELGEQLQANKAGQNFLSKLH